MHNNSAAALLRQILKSVLSLHMFCAEITTLILEILAIHRKEFAENLTLHLIYEVINSVSVEETAFFSIMSMQVKIKSKAFLLLQMRSQRFDSIDCRLFLECWADVVPVEIVAENIHTKVSFENTIHIDHRDNHEHKHLSEKIGSQVFFIRKEFEDTLHCKTRGCLGRMHSCRDQNYRFPESAWSIVFRKQFRIKYNFMCRVCILLIIRSYCQEMDRPAFRTKSQDLLMIVELIDVEKVSETL